MTSPPGGQTISDGGRSVVTTSALAAPAHDVWVRAVSPAGINHELGPWLRMTTPPELRGVAIDDVELGVQLGRSWVLFLGLIPFDFDDLCLAERGPGLRFLESSRTASMQRWEHERTVRPADGGCELTDRVTFELRPTLARLPGSLAIARRLVAAIFRHRHRRARGYFGTLPGGSN